MIELGTASEGAATLETAPTRYVEGSGIRFAYRRLAWISQTYRWVRRGALSAI
jgi:hypothetical protein